MIDKLILVDRSFKIENFDFNLIEKPQEIHDPINNRTRYIGELKNFKFGFWKDHMWIRGSLCKYFLGNNVETLKREDGRSAIALISDELQLDVAGFEVFGLEIGHTFRMNHPVPFYVDHFLSKKRSKLVTFSGESQMVLQGQKALLFYDKLAEVKKKDPGTLKKLLREKRISDKCHYLRYEVQLRKKVKAQLGLGQLKAADLFNPVIYKILVQFWRDEFHKIEMKRDILEYNLPPPVLPKAFIESLAAWGLEEGGIEDVLALVKRKYRSGEMSTSSFYNLTKKIYGLKNKFFQKSDYLIELENDIENVFRHCR